MAWIPRSRFTTLFVVKISMCSYEKPDCPGYRDLGFCDGDISVTGIKKLLHESSSPVTETTFFYTKIASLTQHSPQKAIVLVLFVFPLLENAN